MNQSPPPNRPPDPVPDKRTLRKQYKEAKLPMGVFIIQNKRDLRTYVGASSNLEAAMNRNRFELTLKVHRNKKLLRDWIALGPESFHFAVIDTIAQREPPVVDYKDELIALRDMWRDEYRSRGELGYDEGESIDSQIK